MKKATTTIPSDWRAATLSRISALIQQADPEAIEEVKWRKPTNPAGVLVWSHDGMICTGETYKNHLRLTFAKGHLLKDHDPNALINTYRAIVIHEGDKIYDKAFQNLIRAAVALNRQAKSAPKARSSTKRVS